MAQLADVLDRDQLYELSAGLKRLADMMIPPPPRAEPLSVASVKAIIRVRRLREAYFGNNLFADPAWDMLLDLYAARLEGRRVSVSSLCIAAAVPPTTALRHITRLETRGLAVKRADAKDRRRVFLELNADTADKIEAFLIAGGAASPLLL